MSNIIEISDKSDNSLQPTNDLQDVNNEHISSDPVVAKLSTIVCRELQQKKDKQKLNQVTSACITIFACVLCVGMAVVIITKILEDGDRAKLYDTLSEQWSPKVYKDQIEPRKLKPELLKSSNSNIQPQIAFSTTESEKSLNNFTTEASVNNELVITSESYVNADTEDPTNDTNDIPTVEPLQLSSSGNINSNSVQVLSFFFTVLLISNFKM